MKRIIDMSRVNKMSHLLEVGKVLSSHSGVQIISIGEDLKEITLSNDRIYRLGETDYGSITWWPTDGMRGDHDCVVILEGYDDDPATIFYGS